MNQPDLFSGIELKQRALEQVTDNSGDWMGEALTQLQRLPTGDYTGEDVRKRLEDIGCRPHHSNAWGALVSTAIRRRVLIPTGRFTKMKDPRSHARKTEIYWKAIQT